jgi:transposase
MQITTIGLDIAKNVFQIHGIGAAEKVIVRKQLRRGEKAVTTSIPSIAAEKSLSSACEVCDLTWTQAVSPMVGWL